MVKIPTTDELMRHTIDALKRLEGSGTNEEILDEIIGGEKFPPDVVDFPHNDGRLTKLEYLTPWARTYLKFAGAIESPRRGVWRLTPAGYNITDAEIAHNVKEAKETKRKNKQNQNKVRDSADEHSDDLALLPESENDDWKDNLLATVKAVSPTGFERLSLELLRRAGLTNIEHRGGADDKGIDGLGILKMGLVSFRVAFQCKRYDGSVTPDKMRDFRGALTGRADRGIFITTGQFTSKAREEAERYDGNSLIDLVDGDRLCDLLKEYELGVKTAQVESVTVDTSWLHDNFGSLNDSRSIGKEDKSDKGAFVFQRFIL